MNVEAKRSFDRDLKRISDRELRGRIAAAIDDVKQADSPMSIPGIKPLGGPYYRIRVGNYRLGIRIDGETVLFVRCLHRREIYRDFP